MWDILIPIITLIVGFIIGVVFTSFLVKKKMGNMFNDPKTISQLASSMGMNLNQKQLNQVSRKMQGTNLSGKKQNNNNKNINKSNNKKKKK